MQKFIGDNAKLIGSFLIFDFGILCAGLAHPPIIRLDLAGYLVMFSTVYLILILAGRASLKKAVGASAEEELQTSHDELAALKRELVEGGEEAFEQKILAMRVDPALVAQAADTDLPTVSELIEAGREPEEVGEMLANGRARRD